MGSSTNTDWKRRSRAASRSKYLRYSAKVVAPIHCSSPRAKAGFSRLEASMAPSEPPAPMRVWSSSMNRMMSLFSRISFRICLIRSSNSPRYFVPATTDARSRERIRFFNRLRGTVPLTMWWARPSTMAVFPTPGSPISTGLFFVRRDRSWITRRTSFSRPTTGSSCWFRASSVRSRLNSAKIP